MMLVQWLKWYLADRCIPSDESVNHKLNRYLDHPRISSYPRSVKYMVASYVAHDKCASVQDAVVMVRSRFPELFLDCASISRDARLAGLPRIAKLRIARSIVRGQYYSIGAAIAAHSCQLTEKDKRELDRLSNETRKDGVSWETLKTRLGL